MKLVANKRYRVTKRIKIHTKPQRGYCGATGSKQFAIDDASEAWNRRAEDGK